MREFRRVDAAIAKVLDMKDIFSDEHYAARGMIAEVDGVTMQDVVARMSKTPGKLKHAGRAFGADSERVLGKK
jgi:crotonobetainyl-CoA:carnitine CoA-transferase CaiB-like acyl-CoA transferase